MNKHVVIINGSGGSGKDTFISEFSKICPNTINYSSVQKIKEIARHFGWNGDKTEKDRILLTDLKVASVMYNDMPFTCMKEVYGEMMKDDVNNYLFLHVREPPEIERCKTEFKAVTLLITNPRVPVIQSNTSDANVFDYTYDYVVENDGDVYDLKTKAVEFYKWLKVVN